MKNSTGPGAEVSEVERFLRTPDAYPVLDRGKFAQKAEFEHQNRAAAPTYDRVIESLLAGDEPLEVVARPLAGLGQRWMVTLKNYPHLVVFVSKSESQCKTVANTRRLMATE
jgi:hypothetical protein